MPERYPPVERVRARAASGAGGSGVGISVGEDASFVCLVRGLVSRDSAKTNRQVGKHIVDLCQPLFDQRATSMLDDLAELWWKSEHEGTRVRPFASLPIGDRAELRARVKRLLAERTADTLGDQAVLEGETQRLLDLPALALRRANADLERRAERDRQGWSVAASAICAIFAAGRASIAHIGDCRAVRMRRGIYDVLTHEHVLPLPEPGHDIVQRAVGHWGEGPERVVVPVERGDVFLFMTRGLFHQVGEDAIKTELRMRGIEAAARLAQQEQLQGTTQELYAVAVEIL
jgi:hypothetical protein